jgi:hypothetical protein
MQEGDVDHGRVEQPSLVQYTVQPTKPNTAIRGIAAPRIRSPVSVASPAALRAVRRCGRSGIHDFEK